MPSKATHLVQNEAIPIYPTNLVLGGYINSPRNYIIFFVSAISCISVILGVE